MSINVEARGQDLDNIVDQPHDIDIFDGEEKKFKKIRHKKKKKKSLIRRDESAAFIGSLHASPSGASIKSLRSTIITGLNGRVKLTDKHEPLA